MFLYNVHVYWNIDPSLQVSSSFQTHNGLVLPRELDDGRVLAMETVSGAELPLEVPSVGVHLTSLGEKGRVGGTE